VRRILDHEQPVLVADRGEAVHLDGATGEVDGHDRAGATRDRRLGRVEVDQPGAVGHRVEQHRRRAGVLDRIGRGDKRHRRDQDLVAGSDPEHPQRQDQCRSAR